MERARQAMKRHQMQVKHQHQHLSDLLPSNDISDDPDLRYYIPSSQNNVVPLYQMLHRRGSDDPALKVSLGLRFTNSWTDRLSTGLFAEAPRSPSWAAAWTRLRWRQSWDIHTI